MRKTMLACICMFRKRKSGHEINRTAWSKGVNEVKQKNKQKMVPDLGSLTSEILVS